MARLSLMRTGWALIALVGVQTWAGAETPPAQMDFTTHNEIVINAPSTRIWPHIVRLADWKKGPEPIVIKGAEDQIGAQFKVVGGTPKVLEFYSENVEVVAPQRRTIRLNAPDGSLIGY